MTDEEFEQLFPTIRWRQSFPVHLLSGMSRLCCRFCMARHGLKVLALDQVGFKTEEEFQQHLREQHVQAPEASLEFLVCAPCILRPDHPERCSYTTWERRLCVGDCQRELWVGRRGITALEAARARGPFCPSCAVKRGLGHPAVGLKMLTDEE